MSFKFNWIFEKFLVSTYTSNDKAYFFKLIYVLILIFCEQNTYMYVFHLTEYVLILVVAKAHFVLKQLSRVKC